MFQLSILSALLFVAFAVDDPCLQVDYVRYTFHRSCDSSTGPPSSSDVLAKVTVGSVVECQVACRSFPGCRATDYDATKQYDNCHFFFFTNISDCQSNPSVLHFVRVSVDNFVFKHSVSSSKPSANTFLYCLVAFFD
jgi:hypothetical protein